MASARENASSSPDAMTVSQLARRTGIPPRRIRYYVSVRLLPPPVGRGRAAHYTERHLERLQQITALREVNLSLDEIRERLGAAETGVSEHRSSLPNAVAWRRWEVVPGVEMHVREDLDPSTLATVRMLVGAVRHVLSEDDLNDSEGAGLRE